MKKTLLCVCAYCLSLLLFTACGTKNEAAASRNSSTATSDNYSKGESVSSPVLGEALQLITPASETGFYEVITNAGAGTNIVYRDLNARKEIFLCSRPECRHNDESCTSYLGAATAYPPQAYFANGKLLIVKSGISDGTAASIFTSNSDGSERQTLAKLPSNRTIASEIYTDGAVLVFVGGGIGGTNSIMEISLSTGEVRETADIGSAILLNAHQRTLYLLNPADGLVSLVAANIDAPSMDNVILEYNPAERSAVCGESYVYQFINETQTVVRTDVATGEEISFVADVSGYALGQIGYDKIAVSAMLMGIQPTADGNNIYSNIYLDFEQKVAIPNTLRTQNFKFQPTDIVGEIGEFYCVLVDFKESTYLVANPDGTTDTIETIAPQYAFIAKENFWNCVPNYIAIESEVYQ